jgi:hypothetical protein
MAGRTRRVAEDRKVHDMTTYNWGWSGLAGVVLAASLVAVGPAPANAGNWGISIKEDQYGDFNAHLVNRANELDSETVGNFETRREARQAAREARRDKEDGAEASAETEEVIDTGEMCNNPLFSC